MKTLSQPSLLPLLFLPAMLPASLVHDRQMEAAVCSSYICRIVLENRVEASAERIDDASLTAQIIAALRAHDATRTAAVKVAVTQFAREAHGARFVHNTMKSRD
ncbi:MAG: hypothetical protein ACOZE5_11665 [Verrucomicrobiota bacterium]